VTVPLPPADRLTLEALSESVGPEGDIEVARLMVPVNPLRLVRAIVEVAEEPAWRVKLLGLEVMAKSGCGGGFTVTVTVTAWDNDPLIPVTVIT
jgi:hypothetical protein